MKESFYIYETQYEPVPVTRKCETCNATITCGYVVDNGATIRHYCDYHQPAEYDEWYDKGMAHWTDWYDEVEEVE